MDTEEEFAFLMIIYYFMKRYRLKTLRHKDNMSSLSGHSYTLELLNGSDRQCIDLMRMSKEAFVRICRHFRLRGWLHNSRYVTVEEKMAMFLNIIGQNERYAVIKRRFQHSLYTIHIYFHEVLDAMMEFSKEVIIPTTFSPNPNVPGYHKRLRLVFKGAVGALDGTLIHAIVPSDKQAIYRGRGRGECYQNVLGLCDFNMIFTYVWAGWEGIAHDSRVLHAVAGDPENNFPFPPQDKYYLCDAAYTHTKCFMAPYRGVKYWLGDFRRRRAITKEEKFNHAHAQLRNVIERAYGVLKARFAILKRMAPFDLDTQRDIVIACFAIHNYLRMQNIGDELFNQFEQPDIIIDEEGEAEHERDYGAQGPYWNTEDQQFMNNLRDEIANTLSSNLY